MIDTLWHIAPVVVAIALGYFAGFVTAAVMAVSSDVSRWEDAQPVPLWEIEYDAPQNDSAEVAALKAELEQGDGEEEVSW
jgi:hypothetical protein